MHLALFAINTTNRRRRAALRVDPGLHRRPSCWHPLKPRSQARAAASACRSAVARRSTSSSAVVQLEKDERAGATIRSVDSSHMVMLSQPAVVVDTIREILRALG